MNSRERIELFLCNIKENTVIEASRIYTFLADDMTEAAFYKTLERFCQSDIVTHYIGNQKGLVVGYKLYNEKGLTTQISKQTEVFSNHVPGQRKTIQNVVVKNISCDLNEERVAVIETLEILQNYSKIEDVNKKALITYMEKFAQSYSDKAAVYVLEHMKYKKATIAFLESFLEYLNVNNSLKQFLSSMSVYAIPTMEEIYETA